MKFQYFQRFRKFEVEFNAYVAKHDMHDLFINLMSKCFENNIENPREFISKSLSMSVNESATDEILQLKDVMKKLSNESINLRLKVARLEKRLSESSKEQKRTDNGKRQVYSSSDESLDDQPRSKRVTTGTKKYYNRCKKNAILLSPSSNGSSFHLSKSEISSNVLETTSNLASNSTISETSKCMSSALSLSTDDDRPK